MKLYVGITDGDWHRMLSSRPDIDEVNFWQPGGTRAFRALAEGELFLFKLHSPHNFIVGGGVFAHWTRLPVSMAWEAFGESNGVTSLPEMRRRIAKYRRREEDRHEDYSIGCIMLQQPFFFPESSWIPVPADWKPNLVQGKTYDLEQPVGRRLWDDVQTALQQSNTLPGDTGEPAARYGAPILVKPRLGQGSFRILVTDTYERRCAVSRERTLPVLEAAHIRPFAQGGKHRVDNGLLLRRDLHTLFDRGYVTVTPDHHLEVSRRLKEDWENGRDYYAMQGKQIWTPDEPARQPSTEWLRWHNEECYLG